MKAVAVIIALALAVGAGACSDSHKPPNAAAVSGTSQSGTGAVAVTAAEDGRNLFLANCAGCHGRNADGNTPTGRAWRIPDLRSPQVRSMSDQQLTQIIREGKGKMPAWEGLFSQVDIEHLLAHIRSLKSDANPGVR